MATAQDYTYNELLKEILRRRKRRWEMTANDPKLQQITMEVCRQDIVTWANDWVYIYEPRNLPDKPSTIPLILFDVQEEFLAWLDECRQGKQHGIVEKSRDSGATYLCCLYAVHRWLYEPGFKATFGSRIEKLVDNRDNPDSIFEKIRGILRNLPSWMLPQGFNKKHDKFMLIKNPVTGATLTGEGGENMGRGGRSAVYFLDEAAFIPNAQAVEASLSETSNIVISVSTLNLLSDSGRHFANKRLSNKFPVFTFHWKRDPRKNDAWYANKKATLDPLVLAQEIDIDYSGNIEDVLIPAKWVQAAIDIRVPLKYVSARPSKAGLDVAGGGKNKNVFTHTQGCFVHDVLAWGEIDPVQTAYKAIGLIKERRITHLNYDWDGVGQGVGGILNSYYPDGNVSTELDIDASIDDLQRQMSGLMPAQEWKFSHYAFKGGAKKSDKVWEQFDGKSSSEIFVNLRAEAAWLLRSRFEKTYKYVTEGMQYGFDELISIPDIPELRNQLSQPKFFHTDTGLIRLEKKSELQKRGIESPDYFDSLMMSMYEVEEDFDYIEVLLAS